MTFWTIGEAERETQRQRERERVGAPEQFPAFSSLRWRMRRRAHIPLTRSSRMFHSSTPPVLDTSTFMCAPPVEGYASRRLICELYYSLLPTRRATIIKSLIFFYNVSYVDIMYLPGQRLSDATLLLFPPFLCKYFSPRSHQHVSYLKSLRYKLAHKNPERDHIFIQRDRNFNKSPLTVND